MIGNQKLVAAIAPAGQHKPSVDFPIGGDRRTQKRLFAGIKIKQSAELGKLVVADAVRVRLFTGKKERFDRRRRL